MKKKIKSEQNIIIIMDAIKKIMTIFLGPFLTAYFISTSTNSILNIAIYYIFTYATMALSTLVVAALAEKRYGSLKDYEDAVFLCLGTGIGSAVFLNNQLLVPSEPI